MTEPVSPILDYLRKLDAKMDALEQALQELGDELRSINEMFTAHAIRRAASGYDEAEQGDRE